LKKPLISIIICILSVSCLFVGMDGSYSNNNHNKSYFNELKTSPQNASSIVIGSSYIVVPENAKVVTQVDRVIKDVASNISVNTPPDQSPNSSKQLVPYMEGARVGELMDYANVKVIPITGVTIKNINGNWYGPDEKGNFVFGVDPSKAGPLFSINGSDNLIKIEVNTHGMNVLVPGAINNDAYLVVACGDLPGKAEAENYLSKRGINCYAPCDRFTANLMPYNGTGIIMDGEPIRKISGQKTAIIGAQPVAIDINETIVIQTTKKAYPDQYCDTPNRYFTCLQKAYNITLKTVVVDAGRGETEKVINATNITGAKVIGVRVATAQDKVAVENWLKSDPDNVPYSFIQLHMNRDIHYSWNFHTK